jgi:hypothetical protein
MFNSLRSFCILHLTFCILHFFPSFSQLLYCAEPLLLPRELIDQGWISLFDGQTLYGWEPVGEAKWEVADGEVRTAGNAAGFLTTTTEWGDYELHVEFRAPTATNSGVFLRTPKQPTNPAADCYELNIAPPENPFPTGSFVARHKAALSDATFPAGDQWHSFDVKAEGDTLTVSLDGTELYQFSDPSPVRIGHINLQSREGPVAFRNIRLRPLGLKPLFDGRDLDDWNIERAERSKFDVTDAGELRVINGPGQIETDTELANFVLQLECKVNGDGLNSGIFFRTLRQGRWTGYESQINNRFNGGDRAKPADFGTGGIYRRQPARYVVPEDHEWFTKTIVADGPHMAVWVNGYQVSDWNDPRSPADSPREGRRDGAGVIAIQGHDATTNFLFRDIRAAELPR